MAIMRWTLHGPDDEACKDPWGKSAQRYDLADLPMHHDPKPERVVKTIVERWFTPRRWRMWIGDDDDTVVHVSVIEPPELAGRYRVGIEQVASAAVIRLGSV